MVNTFRLFILLVVLIPCLLAAGFLVLAGSVASSPGAHFTSFTVNGRTFPLTYIATNQSALQKGLTGVEVTNRTTELFVFPTAGYYTFWMYGVNSSLDIMWVDTLPGSSSGTFVYLAPDSPPCHVTVLCTDYTPASQANYVIEAKAGFAGANGIKVGTTVALH